MNVLSFSFISCCIVNLTHQYEKRNCAFQLRVTLRLFFYPADVEKRENPVCHFATPLDGNMDLDVQRPAEVKTERFDLIILWCTNGNSDFVLFLVTEILSRIILCSLSQTLKNNLVLCFPCHFLSLCFVFVMDFGLFPISLFLLQGSTTDGKCWKRRIEIVIREYHKWRTYFKKRVLCLVFYICTVIVQGDTGYFIICIMFV